MLKVSGLIETYEHTIDVNWISLANSKSIKHKIKSVYAQLFSYVNMMQELVDAHDGFKIIQNLFRKEIIEFIFCISTINVI